MGICSSNINVEDYIEKVKHEQLLRDQYERGNLLRFKVEVMVNMLAMEEKKMEALSKRIETLKYVLTKEGIPEQRLSELLKAASLPADVSLISDKDAFSGSAVDLSGAISRVRDEFFRCRDDIVQSFADEEGKIVPALSRDEFMRQLYASTEKLSKTDIQIVSLRFFDGSSVSIPEFLDFFITPDALRLARAAASAVRTSLDLLNLEQHDSYGPDDEDCEDEPNKLIISTHLTEGLDAAAQQLLSLWKDVKGELEARFEDSDRFGSNIVLTARFQEILSEVCGVHSGFVDLARRNNPQNASNLQPLHANAIEIITLRFEIGGRVHYGHFLRFFDETAASKATSAGGGGGRNKKPIARIGASPFRMSSEWAALKAAADGVRASSTSNVGHPAATGLPLPPPRPPVPFIASSSTNTAAAANAGNAAPTGLPNGIAAVGNGGVPAAGGPATGSLSSSFGSHPLHPANLSQKAMSMMRSVPVPRVPAFSSSSQAAAATPAAQLHPPQTPLRPTGGENDDPNTLNTPAAGTSHGGYGYGGDKLRPPPIPANVPDKPGFLSRMMTNFGGLATGIARAPLAAATPQPAAADHKNGGLTSSYGGDGDQSQYLSPDAKAEGKAGEFGDSAYGNPKAVDLSTDYTIDRAKFGTPYQEDQSILVPRFDDSFDRADDKGTPYAPTPAAKRMI